MAKEHLRTGREADGASRAFLQLSEGNELAAESPSIARKAVAVLLSALFLFSVPLLWASTADAGKAVRPAASGPGHDGDGSGDDDDNSGPGGGDDDDTSVTSGDRSTLGTSNTSVSTRDTATSRKGKDTRGTTGVDDSTRATSTGTSRAASTAGTTTGGTTG